jgi:hypothetical protein
MSNILNQVDNKTKYLLPQAESKIQVGLLNTRMNSITLEISCKFLNAVCTHVTL